MLNEGQRLIKPSQTMKQVDWDKLEGVVILGIKKRGETNVLHMSSVTVEELALVTAQLQAHLSFLLGAMKEG